MRETKSVDAMTRLGTALWSVARWCALFVFLCGAFLVLSVGALVSGRCRAIWQREFGEGVRVGP